MNTIETIRAEIERRITENTFGAKMELIDLLSFLDTLEESDRPEPYNPVYDEAYLNEKIAKATKSWKGVDVDAMLDECRGREKSEKPSNHKRNERFDECLAKCDPKVRMEVSDNIDKMLKQEELDLDEAAYEYAQENYEVGSFLLSADTIANTQTEAFTAGAEWAMKRGEVVEGTLGYGPHLQRPIIHLEGVPSFYDGHCQEVIVQIRKK